MDDAKRKAYDALTEAIEAVRRADLDADGGDDAPRYLMTDYVVLFAAQRFDESGETWTQNGVISRDGGGVPHYRILGLLDYVRARFHAEIQRDGD